MSKALISYTAHHLALLTFCNNGVDWSDKEKVAELKKLHNNATKAYSRMSYEEQGEYAELFSNYLKGNQNDIQDN